MAPVKPLVVLALLAGLLPAPSNSNSNSNSSSNGALDEYLAELAKTWGHDSFSPARGEALWYSDHDGRQCTSCHLDSLFAPGRHQKTGKVIEPMAPSVNPKRLTDRKKMKKWLLRNCKWTLGRECTALEKGDILVWLREQ